MFCVSFAHAERLWILAGRVSVYFLTFGTLRSQCVSCQTELLTHLTWCVARCHHRCRNHLLTNQYGFISQQFYGFEELNHPVDCIQTADNKWY